MSWKAGISRYLPALRFFACPNSPSSRGVMQWYTANYEEMRLLNPDFQFLIRTVDNAMPAVTTELEWSMDDLLRFMIQHGKFRNLDNSVNEDRVNAAKEYLKFDWDEYTKQRFALKGFDPESPFLVETKGPQWKDDPTISSSLSNYFDMKNFLSDQLSIIKSGPNDEFKRSENALLMCQRVDLWCAGPKEVERAVIHLYKLGKKLNHREVDMPLFIHDYYPGADDIYS